MEIKVFSTPVCPYCYALKAFLQDKGFSFEDIDVSKNEQMRDYLMEKSKQIGVPAIEIDGEMIVGFDREKIVKALNIKD